MKKLVLTVIGALACALSVQAAEFAPVPGITNAAPIIVDTNSSPPVVSGPITDIINFLGQGSNWVVSTYCIYDNGSDSFGGGLGAFYQVSPFVMAGMRMDYLNDELWMPSGGLQLQAPIKLFNKVTLIPFGFANIGTPVAGMGDSNGEVVGIFGAGAAIKITDKIYIPFDVEIWEGAGFEGEQYRFGLAIKFW